MVSYVKNDVDKEELYVVSAASHHPGVQPGLSLGLKISLILAEIQLCLTLICTDLDNNFKRGIVIPYNTRGFL